MGSVCFQKSKFKVILQTTASRLVCTITPPVEARDQFFRSLLLKCYVYSMGIPCLTRGDVCNLQLSLALASAVTLLSESRETRVNILVSQLETHLFGGLVSCIYYPQEHGNPVRALALGSFFTSYDSQG